MCTFTDRSRDPFAPTRRRRVAEESKARSSGLEEVVRTAQAGQPPWQKVGKKSATVSGRTRKRGAGPLTPRHVTAGLIATLASTVLMAALPTLTAAAQTQEPPTWDPAATTSTSVTTAPTPTTGGADRHPTIAPPPLPPATPGPPPAVDHSPPPVLVVPPDAAARAAEAGRRRAMAELRAAEAELGVARETEAGAAERLRGLDAKVRQAEARLAQRSADEQAAAARLAETRGRIRDLAVAQYLSGGSAGPSVHYVTRARSAEDLARRGSLLSAASDFQRSVATTYERAKKAASEQIAADIRGLEAANAERAQAAAELQAASEQVRLRSGEVEHRRLLLDLPPATAPVGASDIPRLFVDAYRRAEDAMRREAPPCRLSWTAIAAIGKVESDHGRFRGAQLGLNGDLLPPIVGIRLDGTASATITDTDGGQLDGDTAYDRAVGPMQFIPSTWARVARDGNGDGLSNVHNAYDAALGSADYLCRSVPNGRLDLEEGLRAAFFSYNRSHAYVDMVLTWVRTYDGLGSTLGPSTSTTQR